MEIRRIFLLISWPSPERAGGPEWPSFCMAIDMPVARLLPVFLISLLTAGACGKTSPTSPTPSLSGRWTLDNPTGVTGQTIVWILTQTGSSVTGISSRTADFAVTDTGTISGDVSGSSLTFRWDHTTDSGGTGTCQRVRTVSTGTLTVTPTLLAGTISSVPQPPCEGRVSVAQHSFRRQ